MNSLITTSIILVLLLAGNAYGQQSTSVDISTPDQIKEEFVAVPCKDKERLSAVKALFERMGADSQIISVEKYRNVENLTVRKSSASPEIIVIGAHFDKVTYGCGAVDNWSGIVTIAHLYRTLKDFPLKKTVIFVAFGHEEDGLRGSRAMVDAIKEEQLGHYCAMLNIDSFGLGKPQVLDNASSRKLTLLAGELAKTMGMPFEHARLINADADSSSFLTKRIPAITLHGLSPDYASVIHTDRDKAKKVNPTSVYLGYRLALALLIQLDNSTCGTYK